MGRGWGVFILVAARQLVLVVVRASIGGGEVWVECMYFGPVQGRHLACEWPLNAWKRKAVPDKI
jgi:hypothetical protein